MRTARWVVHAAKRTAQAFVPRLARPDDDAARVALQPAEWTLYRALDRRERAHAAAVVRRLLRRWPDAGPELIAAAWLHDLGKARDPFSPWWRVALHLAPGTPPPPDAPARGWRRARQTLWHHPRYGAAMIRDAGGRERVATIVARHHEPAGDADAARLHAVDTET